MGSPEPPGAVARACSGGSTVDLHPDGEGSGPTTLRKPPPAVPLRRGSGVARAHDPLTQEVLSGDETGIAPVYHAFAGAVLAKMEYGITDETILRAIRLHTTGDWGMSDFDALVYAADLIEPTRTFSGVEDDRARLTKDIDPFMQYALGRVCQLIGKKGWKTHPASTRAIAYYDQRINQPELNK